VPVAFVILKGGGFTGGIEKEIKELTTEKIGPFARPAAVYVVTDVPKTRSGKIMRRILKKLLKGEDPGNVTTLSNPDSVEALRAVLAG
jgi:acetyl-CoA synthetase